MPRGNVKWFDPKKGFGFIIGPEGQDVFVHFSAILSEGFRSLRDGQLVDYELRDGTKGQHAREVRAVAVPAVSDQPGVLKPPAAGEVDASARELDPASGGVAVRQVGLSGGGQVNDEGAPGEL